MKQFSASDLAHLVTVCLSSSLFSGPEWKRTALTVAKMAIQAGPGDELLSGQWRLRTQRLCRLYPVEFKKYHTDDASWNAHQGNLILFEVQNLMYRGEFDYARHRLENLELQLGPSTLERLVRHRATLLKSKICQLEGDFTAALEHLVQMQRATNDFKECMPKYHSQLIEVYCELGETSNAARWIPTVDVTSASWLDSMSLARRTSVAAAGILFMEGCISFIHAKEDETHAKKHQIHAKERLHAARAIYTKLETKYGELPRSRVTIFRQFSISVCLAMIAHLECILEPSSRVTGWLYVYGQWQAVLEVAKKMRQFCAWDVGFPEVIVAFSKCDVTYELGWSEETDKLVKEGRCLYQKTGRQFAWLGLGTVWFDLIGDRLQSKGYGKIDDRLEDWRRKRENNNAH